MSVGIILIAATACANPQVSAPQPTTGQQVPPSSSIAPGHPAQSVPDGSVVVPAGQIDATALPAGSPREVYIGPDGKILSVKAEEGGCGHAVATLVEQSSHRVVITLSETPTPPGQVCTMDIRYPMVSAALAAPLAQRTVALIKEPRRR